MEKVIVVGSDNFDKFIKENGYYVDKTELIYELLTGNRNEVTLFTRPRRFGKTLTMSMLESFFDIRRDSREIFQGLNIVKNHQDFCREWMNSCPVLFLSFKDVEGLSFEKAYEKLKTVIADLCKKHDYLEHEKNVNPADAETFHRLKFETANESHVKNALKTIMRMMHDVYGKPAVLLIDEYDVPLAKAQASGDRNFYIQMLDLVRSIMSTSLKTNEFLKFAVVTGCLRVSKESVFTGVNNFSCYSVMSNKFSKYFGFEEFEVRDMLNQFGMDNRYDLIRQWYDGYIFGNTDVFCPWDVAKYIASVKDGEDGEPRNFWANTSSNSVLDGFVNHPNIDASEKFEALLNGGTVTVNVNEELTYDTMSTSERNLWSVLLMTGYVSKADKSGSKTGVSLRIPNAEVADLLREAVVERFNRSLDTGKADGFINAMWIGDERNASNLLTEILWNSISYFDYGEDYYHGMLNGIFTSRGYSTDSNDESGFGRLDLRVRDRVNRRTLLLEFKRTKSEDELDAGCDEAIAQIIKNGYAKNIPEGYRVQVVYGIAFYGKIAKVKLLNTNAI